MASVFWLDPDYRDFVPQVTPLKFDMLYRGGALDVSLVVFFSLSAAVLLVFVVALILGMDEVNVLTVMLLDSEADGLRHLPNHFLSAYAWLLVLPEQCGFLL